MYQTGTVIRSSRREVEFDQGRHKRAKLGFILMSTDLAAEADLPHSDSAACTSSAMAVFWFKRIIKKALEIPA
jgi:hypothetical protein